MYETIAPRSKHVADTKLTFVSGSKHVVDTQLTFASGSNLVVHTKLTLVPVMLRQKGVDVFASKTYHYLFPWNKVYSHFRFFVLCYFNIKHTGEQKYTKNKNIYINKIS